MKKRNTLDMTTGPIFRKLLLFAYPLMINSLIHTLYGTVDKVIAGQFISSNAMAAVGVTEQPLLLIINFFIGIGAGVAIVCGSYLGGKKTEQLRDCMHTSLPLGLIFGAAVCVLGLAVTEPLLVGLDTPAEILPEARTYMLVRMLGTPVTLFTTFCSNIMTAHGDTRRITVIGILSGLVNVLGNLLFVLGFGMGVESLAIATVLSQVFAMVAKIWILFSPSDDYKMQFSQLRLHWKYVKEVCAIGIPSGINSTLFSLSNVIVQGSINSMGAVVVKGNAAADSLMSYATLFPSQMAAACSCAVAQCYGAKDYARIRKITRQGILGSLGMMLVANCVITVFMMPLLRLFYDSPDVAVAGIPSLMISTWGYMLCHVFSMVFSATLRGMHKSMLVTVISVVTICVPRLLWVWFVFPHFKTPIMLFVLYPISWAISSASVAIAYWYTIKKKQAQAQIPENMQV